MPSLKISQKGGTSGEYAQGSGPSDNVVSEDGEQERAGAVNKFWNKATKV